MDNFITSLIEANIALAMLGVLYFLFRQQFSLNYRRFIILFIPILTTLIFVIKNVTWSSALILYRLPVFEFNFEISKKSETPVLENTINVFPVVYMIISALFLLIFLIRIISTLWSFRGAVYDQEKELKVVYQPDAVCSSFFSRVMINSNLADSSKEIILQHEKIHATKKHSLDLLLMNFLHAIFWINPIQWILRKELIAVQEYQVDAIMYNKHNSKYMEFLLSYSLGTGSTSILLTHQFYSKISLIQRLKNMKQNLKSKWQHVVIIPSVALSLVAISWTSNGKFPTVNHVSVVDAVAENADKMPEFKGGQEAMMNYLSSNLTYPESAKNNKIEGTVYIEFVVSSIGKITEAKVKKGVSSDLDAEALRVVSGMPDWIPAEKDGKNVAAQMMLPINFKL